jgi:hypothetical protein
MRRISEDGVDSTVIEREMEIAKDQIPYVYYEMDDLFSIYINKILALILSN